MSRMTIVNLMTGVALAALVSGSAAWAQTATEQSEELLQQQQQQVTPEAGEAPEAPAAGAEAEAEAGAEIEAQTETQVPEEQVTEEAPAGEQPEEQVTEEAPAEQPQEEVTEAPEADETTEAQQQQQQQTQETTVNVDIDQSQETVIRQTVLEHPHIEPVSVDLIDFELAVGAVVTSTAVALHPVPVEIVQAVPRFRGHLHFVLADQRIVIVDPCTLRVVTIIA